MIPSRIADHAGLRKSRLEGKPSLLPKPRRPGSTDRLSVEARRPSTTGHRSSSAEPRGTIGVGRLSREASATKLQTNKRSRSQQSERFGQSTMTPLRSSHYSRSTTTPVRTPTEDGGMRNWQTSLDRALAFVSSKDQRPISNAAWQRAEYARVQEMLSRRAEGGGLALVRPLTIARFLDVTGALLAVITGESKLNKDNYVTKLPHLCKRLLYPGVVSKSWLKTVNTLHAFPHAVALIAYLLDIVAHLEMPVSDDWLYVRKDDLAKLRRDYLEKCWIRFQDPNHQFDDLDEEYLENLKLLLGNDEEKIFELQQIIKKYEICLEDEAETAARAEEARLTERRDALMVELKAERALRREWREELFRQDATRQHLAHGIQQADHDTERAQAESHQLKREVEQQVMSVTERARLLDEVDYSRRVLDSKLTLANDIQKRLVSKETELALWQKQCLDSCVEFNQGLLHLAATFPDLPALAVDEKDLMESECVAKMSQAVDALKKKATSLAEGLTDKQRTRSQQSRQRVVKVEESRAKIVELRAAISRLQLALHADLADDAAHEQARDAEHREIISQIDELNAMQEEFAKADSELDFWEKQEAAWQAKLTSMEEYIQYQRVESQRVLQAAIDKRLKLVSDKVQEWGTCL